MNQLESIASTLSEGTEEQIKNALLLRRINSAVRSQLLHSKQLLAKANAECELLQDQRKELLAALQKAAWFIENVTADDPRRTELFFEVREAWRVAMAKAVQS